MKEYKLKCGAKDERLGKKVHAKGIPEKHKEIEFEKGLFNSEHKGGY